MNESVKKPAGILDRLRKYWRKDEVPFPDPNVKPDSGTQPETLPLSDKVDNGPFYWIENEGLLRDEGVLFGISGAEIEEKLAAIQNYYANKQAPLRAQKDLLDEKIGALRDDLRDANAKHLEKSKLEKDGLIGASEHKLVRHLVAFLLIVVANYGNFFLVGKFVEPTFGFWGAIGVYLFGLFTSMSPVSSWLGLETETSPGAVNNFKNALLEVGPPVVTTLLIGQLAYASTQDVGLSISLILFMLFMFFFLGKLTLGLCQMLVKDWRVIVSNQREKKYQRAKSKEEADQQVNFTEEEKSKLAELEEKEKQLVELISGIETLEQQKKTKVQVFKSEYLLASKFKSEVKNDKNIVNDVV